MFRARIWNLKLNRNTVSKNVIILSINQRPMSNLNQQNFNWVLDGIYNKNYTTIINKTSETIFPIAINDISLNSHNNNNDNNKPLVRNSANKHKTQRFTHSPNHTLTKCNTLHKTSTFLMRQSRINPPSVRHLSSEATRHVPIVQLTGFWKDMSESAPVEFVQNSLISLQSSTDLPWWATIVLTTFVVRATMTLPLSLYQHYIFAKIQNLQGRMTDEVEKLKIEANIAVSHHNWSEAYTRMVYNKAVKSKWNEIIQKENCHPAKGFIVLWSQIPLWITISAALRNLCYMLPPSHENAEKVFLELTTGGFGWIVNLTAVDHYWIIPVSIGIFNLANIEVMALMKMKEDTRLQKCLLFFFRFISIAMVPIATYVPSCICLYWASSSAFSLLQNLVLVSPKVRRLGGVPLTSTERTNPYRDLVQNFRAKKYFKFSPKGTSLE